MSTGDNDDLFARIVENPCQLVSDEEYARLAARGEALKVQHDPKLEGRAAQIVQASGASYRRGRIIEAYEYNRIRREHAKSIDPLFAEIAEAQCTENEVRAASQSQSRAKAAAECASADAWEKAVNYTWSGDFLEMASQFWASDIWSAVKASIEAGKLTNLQLLTAWANDPEIRRGFRLVGRCIEMILAGDSTETIARHLRSIVNLNEFREGLDCAAENMRIGGPFPRKMPPPPAPIPEPQSRAPRSQPSDPITLPEMARLGMIGEKTIRNWGTKTRPLPVVEKCGRRPAVYSYCELRTWCISKRPDKQSSWPDDYSLARNTLAQMSS